MRGIDLSVSPGEIIGVLGPNGAGKTTLLRIAAGVLSADSGSVLLEEKPITPKRPRSRVNVGYLPEKVPLYDVFTPEEQLRFVAKARGIASSKREDEITHRLEQFNLEGARKTRIKILSKGYKQRVALAQSLIGEPSVLLLDEPTNGLDPLQLVDARSSIIEAARGRAVLLSTHIVSEVEALCTGAVCLSGGEVLKAPPTRQTTPSQDEWLELQIALAPSQLAEGIYLIQDLENIEVLNFEDDDTIDVRVAKKHVGELIRKLSVHCEIYSVIPIRQDFEAGLVELFSRQNGARK